MCLPWPSKIAAPLWNPRGKRLRIQGMPEKARRQQNISNYLLHLAVYIRKGQREVRRASRLLMNINVRGAAPALTCKAYATSTSRFGKSIWVERQQPGDPA